MPGEWTKGVRGTGGKRVEEAGGEEGGAVFSGEFRACRFTEWQGSGAVDRTPSQ